MWAPFEERSRISRRSRGLRFSFGRGSGIVVVGALVAEAGLVVVGADDWGAGGADVMVWK